MAPRSASFDREEVLAAIVQRFRQHGFVGTSMRDVQQATGLSPTSLYAAFGNKERLFEQALQAYRDQAGEVFAAAVGDPDRGLEAIRSYLCTVVDQACPKYGCLLGKALTDGAGDRAEAIVREAFDQLEGLLTRALTVAQAQGTARRDRDPRSLARLVQSLAFGLQMQTRRGLPRQALIDLVDQTLAAIAPTGSGSQQPSASVDTCVNEQRGPSS